MAGIDSITPKTIAGIKRLANRMKKADDIPLHAALDLAARRVGYADYAAALRCLRAPRGPKLLEAPARILLWHGERHRSRYDALGLPLTRHVADLVRREDTRLNSALRGAILGQNTLEISFVGADERLLRRKMGHVARTLQFMDATGLRSGWPAQPDFICGEVFFDHVSFWHDPVSGARLLLNEPYGSARDFYEPQWRAWCEARDLEIGQMEWGGTYAPENGSVCDMMSPRQDGGLIEQVISALDAYGPGYRS